MWLLGAVILGVLPFGAPAQVAGGTKIHLVSNGWHVSLVLPAGDWPRALAHGPYRVDVSQARLVAFGWGERRFYMDTRTLADLDIGLGLRALAWNADTVVHATFLDSVDEAHPRVRTLTVSPAQLAALNEYVRGSFADATPDAIGEGFGAADAFFRAQGVYSPIATCNEWVGAALRRAGIPVGAWTPLSQSLLWRLP